MDAPHGNKTQGEKARWELHKNATCYFEQILEVTPYKQQLYSHLHPISKKPYKEEKQVMQDTDGEARINS